MIAGLLKCCCPDCPNLNLNGVRELGQSYLFLMEIKESDLPCSATDDKIGALRYLDTQVFCVLDALAYALVLWSQVFSYLSK
jgi:hypothetical protein